jgi:hypothetical protein
MIIAVQGAYIFLDRLIIQPWQIHAENNPTETWKTSFKQGYISLSDGQLSFYLFLFHLFYIH